VSKQFPKTQFAPMRCVDQSETTPLPHPIFHNVENVPHFHESLPREAHAVKTHFPLSRRLENSVLHRRHPEDQPAENLPLSMVKSSKDRGLCGVEAGRPPSRAPNQDCRRIYIGNRRKGILLSNSLW